MSRAVFFSIPPKNETVSHAPSVSMEHWQNDKPRQTWFDNPRDKEFKRRQIELFKILNGYENIDRHNFLSIKKDSRTTGHEATLVKYQCRLDIRKYLFSQKTINEWNTLFTDCVNANSVNMSKNKVHTYLRRAGYT